jgi:co-chaperonin GroES (HSP10)
MTFTLRPLGDRVVVKAEDDLEQRTPSGLVIPDTAK